jgi:hypothetical protein
MIAKRIFLALIITAVATANLSVASAQSEKGRKRQKSGWASLVANGPAAPIDQQFETAQEMEIQKASGIKPHAPIDPRKRLVGTWYMTVPDSPGAPGFNAFQTFNEEGTMTETSSLLGHLAEGPAHGVWEGKDSNYKVTFEVFVFDENGDSVGRVRVRVAITLIGNDNLTANSAVDFIEPDGTVIPNIGSSPFTGTRMKVLNVQ